MNTTTRRLLAGIALLTSGAFLASCVLDPPAAGEDPGGAQSQLASPERMGLVFLGNQPGFDPAEVNRLADITAATGVRWAVVEARWSFSEPSEPTAAPTGPNDLLGPRLGYHHYDFSTLDAIIAALQARGIEPVVKIFKHPTWAGGQNCDVFVPSCGIILQTHKQKFRDGLFDFAYHLGNRYRTVKYWGLWNEPNLDQSFSPQPPLAGGGLIAEYLGTVANPMKQAIRSSIPDSKFFGPDLFTCSSGDDCTQEDKNWRYTTRWGLWVDSIARFDPGLFDVLSFHNYGSDERGALRAASVLGGILARYGVAKPVWTTEFNFRSGTCSDPETSIASWTYALGRDMFWERVFFYSLLDSNQTCGFGLMTNPGNPAGGLQTRPYLYPAFTRIVNGGGP